MMTHSGNYGTVNLFLCPSCRSGAPPLPSRCPTESRAVPVSPWLPRDICGQAKEIMLERSGGRMAAAVGPLVGAPGVGPRLGRADIDDVPAR